MRIYIVLGDFLFFLVRDCVLTQGWTQDFWKKVSNPSKAGLVFNILHDFS